MEEVHHISPAAITVDEIAGIVENNRKIALSDEAKRRVVRCREYLDKKIESSDEPVYGVTTGFGSLCNVSIDHDSLRDLQRNLVMSHACGMGEESCAFGQYVSPASRIRRSAL